MPDYGDLYGTYANNGFFMFIFWGLIFLFLVIAGTFDFIRNLKQKQKKKSIEDFYDVLAESDIRTSFTCSDAED